MRIVYIEKFKEVYDEESKAKTLERFYQKVERVEEGTLDNNKMEEILASKPDLILFTKLKVNPILRYNLIKKAKAKGIKTVSWIPDLYFGLAREAQVIGKDSIFDADYVFSPDGGNQERFDKLGIKHYLLRQSIAIEDCYIGKKIEAPEIVFVGSKNPEYGYRNHLMEFLTSTYGDRFHWYGRTNTAEVRGEKLNDLYNSAIVIGDSVYSPHYWSNRIYEVLGRGGFLIHPMIEGIEKEFKPFKHFIPYNHHDYKGLKEKIDYFLEHEEERDKIRMAGFAYCKKNHTLDNRCRQFLDYVTAN